MNPRSVTLGDGPPEDNLDHGPLYLTLEQVRAYKRRPLLLATSMTGDLQKDKLSTVLIRNLPDETSKVSGPNVAETEPTSAGRTRDAGVPNKSADDPPASVEDLAPAACREDSASSESTKSASSKEESNVRGAPRGIAMEPPVYVRGGTAEMPPSNHDVGDDLPLSDSRRESMRASKTIIARYVPGNNIIFSVPFKSLVTSIP